MDFKAKFALEAIREDLTLAALYTHHDSTADAQLFDVNVAQPKRPN